MKLNDRLRLVVVEWDRSLQLVVVDWDRSLPMKLVVVEWDRSLPLCVQDAAQERAQLQSVWKDIALKKII